MRRRSRRFETGALEQKKEAVNTLLRGWLAATLVFMAGCASPSTVVRTTIGPQLAPAEAPPQGYLIVYTATQVSGYTVSESPVYSSYSLSRSDGTASRTIENRAGPFSENPQLLPLPSGEYRVKGLAEGGGEVTVPVRIEAGRTTKIDLARLAAGEAR